MNDSAGVGSQSLLDDSSNVLSDLTRMAGGDSSACDRLATRSEALRWLVPAIQGDRHAFAALRAVDPLQLDELCSTLLTAEMPTELSHEFPQLHLLIDAVRGDQQAFHKLARKRASLGKLADFLRDICANEEDACAEANHDPATEDAAADVGLLVGEQHLRDGAFKKAILAFTRAIE